MMGSPFLFTLYVLGSCHLQRFTASDPSEGCELNHVNISATKTKKM